MAPHPRTEWLAETAEWLAETAEWLAEIARWLAEQLVSYML